jgi:hypothetical protein
LAGSEVWKKEAKTQRRKPMKTVKQSIKSLQIISVSLAWLTGCSTTGYHKSDAAAKSLNVAAAEIHAQRHALEATTDALQDLVNKPAPDLKPQFVRFSDALDRLSASARRNQEAARRVSEKSADYFLAWDKELTGLNYEVIRSRGEARKEEVAGLFKVVNRHYHDAQAALQPLVDYLEDIRKTLSADLTAPGLESVKGFVANAQENGSKVNAALSKLSTVLTDASTSMSSAPSQIASTESTNQQATAATQAAGTAKP